MQYVISLPLPLHRQAQSAKNDAGEVGVEFRDGVQTVALVKGFALMLDGSECGSFRAAEQIARVCSV